MKERNPRPVISLTPDELKKDKRSYEGAAHLTEPRAGQDTQGPWSLGRRNRETVFMVLRRALSSPTFLLVCLCSGVKF